MANPSLVWCSVLSSVAVLQLVAFAISSATFGNQRSRERRLLLILSGAYVLGCAFRSFYPMIDLSRICLQDTWFTRIAVGRTIATVAEVAFAAQLALVVRRAGRALDFRPAVAVSAALVPLILIAEACCWTAVLTQNYLLHVFENSLWTLGAALILAALPALMVRADDRSRRVIATAIVTCAVYVAYMLAVDLPMYVGRWQLQLASGRGTIPFAQGVREVLARCTVVQDWAIWRPEALWLSLYFTLGVCASIALAHLPPPKRRAAEAPARLPAPATP